MKKIALFASGNGTNVERIIKFFKNSKTIKVSFVVCNNPEAMVVTRARNLKVPVILVGKNSFFNTDGLVNQLKSEGIDFIFLAGFLWLIPKNLLTAFPNKIFNLHPALLPKFGGKGMYGMHVHEAVLEANEPISGITIHEVNEHYDEGQIVAQFLVQVDKTDTPESLAAKIHKLEYIHYPEVIAEIVTK